MIGTLVNTGTILLGSVVGAMIKKGLNEKYQTMLYDAMGLAATYGIGIAFSALVLFLWQSSIFLLAGQAAPFLTGELMTEISIIGGFLILASGLSILKVKQIRTLNLLPSLLIPLVWFAVIHLL